MPVSGVFRLASLYALDVRERVEVAVGAPIPPGGRTPDLECLTLPGGPVVETVHTGPYEQLPLAYNALFATVHERGLRPAAPVREVYLAGPGQAPPEDLTTRLIIPLQERAA